MKTEKLNLKSIKNVLSRAEMKKIMAGSGCGRPGAPCGYNGGLPPGPACCSGHCLTDQYGYGACQ